MNKIRFLTLLSIFLLVFSSISFANQSPTQIIAEDYNVSQTDIINAQSEGFSFQDINRASFIALATNQSLEQVIKYKTIAGDWNGTASLAGLTDWHIRYGQHALMANQLHNLFDVDKTIVMSLLEQQYHPKAVALASALSQKANADLEIVMSKKSFVSWYDVGSQIGLSRADIDEVIQAINTVFADRANFGDYYGYHGETYGYNDSDYYINGYDIEVVNIK